MGMRTFLSLPFSRVYLKMVPVFHVSWYRESPTLAMPSPNQLCPIGTICLICRANMPCLHAGGVV